VAADTALVADGLATALFFVPAQHLRPHFDFEYVIMKSNGTAEVSPGFPGEIFYAPSA
jgi:thiamine biosynthesis lipoprotein